MPELSPADRKRVRFIACVLGIMAGISAFLIFVAIAKGNVALIAAILPMFIASIPMTKELIRLRKLREPVE